MAGVLEPRIVKWYCSSLFQEPIVLTTSIFAKLQLGFVVHCEAIDHISGWSLLDANQGHARAWRAQGRGGRSEDARGVGLG